MSARHGLLGFVALAAVASGCTLLVGTFEGTGATGTGANSTGTLMTTGTRGSGGAGSTTGPGGGGMGGCMTIATCPPAPNQCVQATCVNAMCGTQNVPMMVIKKDPSGNCTDIACDGMGHVTTVPDPNNPPMSVNPCLMGICEMGGTGGGGGMGGMGVTPSTQPQPSGTMCTTPTGGTVCDGVGDCVECLMSSDCIAGDSCTATDLCVPASCSDGVKDNGETDVDCGGPNCSPCADFKMCVVGSDCLDKVCTNGTCAAPTCNDGVENGTETDVDCGGTCPGCGPDQTCKVNTDCTGMECGGGTCTPDCTDGMKDGNETDVDCGGGTCPTCTVGKGCMMDSDCTSDACDVTSHTCVASQCSDGQKDGNETDVDCGGGTCSPCTVGKMCKLDTDCTSMACDVATNLCIANQCADGQKDGSETDVDCGGTCPACATGKKCKVDGDCTSMACSVSSLTCVANQCTDGQKDGSETDVDCGGGTCPTCVGGKMCKANSDCTAGVCSGGTCAAPGCSDGVKNGNETDVDCGGGTCPTCGPNKMCLVNTDCTGGQCAGGTCTPDCSDGVKNNSETDVDCGGGTCPACATGKDCKIDSDCVTNACDASSLTCDASQCADGRKDGNETDVDCGGGTCSGCVVGKNCKVDSDCTSSACDALSLTCVANQCADHQKDGSETDVDCGGSACPTCANGKKCKVDTDCTSMGCDAVSFTCDASQCMDNQKDGNETDVDCGGGTCSGCATGKVCKVNTDCLSGACDFVTGKCVASTCVDQRQDGAETDVDCGGGTCATCGVGLKCSVDSDCTSNACDTVTGQCVASQCADQHQDGAETDVDCGGGTCPQCAIGLKCVGDGDCVSPNACDAVSLTCVANQCSDHRQDGSETDVDCGGSDSCARCASGKMCASNGDCQAGHTCSGVSHTCS